MKELYFITSNKGKVIEAEQKFSEINIDIIQKDLGYPEIQSDNLIDVARFGVENIKKRFDKPFILEDAGLFIDILNGFPGVYSAYVYYTIGCRGILKLMNNYKGKERKACFKSAYAYSDSKEEIKIFQGESIGTISIQELGRNGFGYDPIFIPEGSKKTFAEMEVKEKNNYSHRGKALNKLSDFFKNKRIEKIKRN